MNFGTLLVLFFLVGLFTIGGGLVAIPLLQEFVQQFELLSSDQFISMVAIAQATPGSIGVNISTFVGLSQFGLAGAIAAPLAFILPSILIITTIARFSPHFLDHPFVGRIFTGVRPAVTGIIASGALSLFITVFHLSDTLQYSRSLLFSALLFATVLLLRFLTSIPSPFLIIGAGVGSIFLF